MQNAKNESVKNYFSMVNKCRKIFQTTKLQKTEQGISIDQRLQNTDKRLQKTCNLSNKQKIREFLLIM